MLCGIDSIMLNIPHIQYEYYQSHITLLWILIILCWPSKKKVRICSFAYTIVVSSQIVGQQRKCHFQ